MRLIQQAVIFVLFVEILSTWSLSQQKEAHGAVHGVVVLKSTSASASGTVVSLRPRDIFPTSISASDEYVIREKPNLTAIVGRDGIFRMDNVPPGNYVLMTYKPGYFDPDAVAAKGFMRELHVAAGETRNIAIHLEHGGAIEGQIRFDNGTPAQTSRRVADGVAVSVEIESSSGSLGRFGDVAHTDAEGHYKIGGLPAGTYIVFAAMPGRMVAVKGGEVLSDSRIVFAPRGVRASKAERIEVHPPDTVSRVDIVVQTRALHTISGQVTDQNGAPVTEGLVWLSPAGETVLPRSSRLGKNGDFSFHDVPDDNYTVEYKSYPQAEVLGVTADGTGLRERMRKAPFFPAIRQVRISGQDLEGVVLRAKPAR